MLLSTGDGRAVGDPGVHRGPKQRFADLSGTPREQASRLISLLFLPARARMIDAAFGDVVADARAALPADVVRAQWRAMEEWEGARGAQNRSWAGSRFADTGGDRQRGRRRPTGQLPRPGPGGYRARGWRASHTLGTGSWPTTRSPSRG